jgi:hexokinase
VSKKARVTSERLAFIDQKMRERDQRRLREMASGISTEEMLQVILADVAPEMRASVEAAIRPYTSIPYAHDGEVGEAEGRKPTVN